MFKKINFRNCVLLFFIVLHILCQSTYANEANDSTTHQDINSRAAVVIDRKTKTILYGKDENTKRKMASTTKIMTCLIAIEKCNLSDCVEVSKKAASTGGSRLGLKTGDKITVNDLLYGLMLCSGNDAAVAIAEHISGSITDFSALMNAKAKELNLQNTNFESPHGLDSSNHYTTAYELALLSNYALENSTFSKIVSTKSYNVTINGSSKNINNTNELLGYLNGVYGIKTGFTNGANRCLVTACKRDNFDIICVVLGADTKKFRTNDSIYLIEYVFDTYEPVDIKQLLDNEFNTWKKNELSSFNVIKGISSNVDVKISKLTNDVVPLKKNLQSDINFSINCEKDLYAPIYAGDEIGKVSIYCGDSLIDTCNIVLDCSIEKKTPYAYFFDLFKLYSNFSFT